MFQLIVGLGNPTEDFELTRHNAGFLFLDKLANFYNLPTMQESSKFKAQFGKTAEGLFFLKPLTYMNNSGESVLALSNFYKIEKEKILVIQDELDLKLGKVRITDSPNSAGHNGIKNIVQNIGEGFYRIRFGVGRPENKEKPIRDYVLEKFSQEEMGVLEKQLDLGAQNFYLVMEGKFQEFLNRMNNGV